MIDFPRHVFAVWSVCTAYSCTRTYCFCNKDVIICMYCYWIFVISSCSSTLAILGLSSESHMTNSHPVTSLHTWDPSSICWTISTWQPEWQIGYMNTLGFFFHPRLVHPPSTMFSRLPIELGPIRNLNLVTMALVGAVKLSAIWKTIPFGMSRLIGGADKWRVISSVCFEITTRRLCIICIFVFCFRLPLALNIVPVENRNEKPLFDINFGTGCCLNWASLITT